MTWFYINQLKLDFLTEMCWDETGMGGLALNFNSKT